MRYFKHEKKFKAMEEERTDALEMAKKAYEEREEAPCKKVKL